MLRLDGKVALVTGCGTRGEGWGNGKAIAVLLARQGATVFGVDRDLDAAKVTQKIIEEEGGKAHVTTANVTIAEDVQNMVKSCMDMLGRIDILINNVGQSEPGGPVEMSEETWDGQMDLNVKTAFFKTGESKVELLESLTEDGVIAKFIHKKGEGMHHVAFAVENLASEILRLKAEGFAFINGVPKKGADNKLICFLHPKSTNGILIELCQEIEVE